MQRKNKIFSTMKFKKNDQPKFRSYNPPNSNQNQDLNKPIDEIKEDLEIPTKFRNVNYQVTWKDKLLKFIEHPLYKIFYILITIYILFTEDVKLILTDYTSDLFFSLVTIFIILLFTVEIIFYNIVYDEEYTCGLYFWIDLFGLASMLLDLHWINDYMIQASPNLPNKNLNQRNQGLNRLARGVRIVTRAIRMIRYIKLLKLFRNSMKPAHMRENEEEESKVGQILEALLLRRIIILILLMVISIVFFNPSFYYIPKTQMEFGFQIFKHLDPKDPLFNLTFDVYVEEGEALKFPLIYIQVHDKEWGNITLADELRSQEKIELFDYCGTSFKHRNQTESESNCIAIFDNRFSVKFGAMMNIIKTFSICLVLGGGMVCFSKDTNDLVIEPIAKMTKKIKHLSQNPIAAMQQNLNEGEEKGEENKITALTKKAISCFTNKQASGPLETIILEKTISKISTLLALGFGEAGSEIISTNMQKGGDGDVNPMVPGRKVMAIYGFCDIRNFTDTTEVLQEKVMIFVNEIAEIVHEITSLYCGSANKNIGDAFLLVWKLDESFVERCGDEVKLIKNDITGGLVDMALIAFVKILAAVHKSHKLNQYRKHEALCERMPNYSVKMGFGLHLGYSIEGAIGSMFKIDASYLSPNVNVASKLEEKTKEYKVQLILSDDFVDHLSSHARKDIRLIDQIAWEAKADKVLRLYTCDFDLTNLRPEKEDNLDFDLDEDLNKKMENIKLTRDKRKILYDETISGKSNPWNQFVKNDIDWHIMRSKYTEEFYHLYDLGVQQYISGDWQQAKNYFEQANKIVDNQDGPIHNFLNFMHSKNYTPDLNWNGVRDDEHDGH